MADRTFGHSATANKDFSALEAFLQRSRPIGRGPDMYQPPIHGSQPLGGNWSIPLDGDFQQTADQLQGAEWAAYGAQLRTWIRLQVEEHLNRLLPNLEASSIRAEVTALRESQDKLLAMAWQHESVLPHMESKLSSVGSMAAETAEKIRGLQSEASSKAHLHLEEPRCS